MIDSLGECIGGPEGDIWIEIADSQLKFEPDGKDNLYPDPERVTFEVNAFSKPLTEASLNFQLMTILAACKVPFQVFCDLLEADLTAKVADLEAAMESGLTIRKWNQEVNPVTSERMAHGVEMQGGMPSTLPEKINWFVEVRTFNSVLTQFSTAYHLSIARVRATQLLPAEGPTLQGYCRILHPT